MALACPDGQFVPDQFAVTPSPTDESALILVYLVDSDSPAALARSRGSLVTEGALVPSSSSGCLVSAMSTDYTQ